MENRKLLVLGASGAIGQQVVRIAKERGHQVTVLVRPEANYKKPEGVEVILGNVLDVDVVEKIMKGQDAVLSCLGIKRETPHPAAPLISPPDLARDSAQNIVQAMKKHDVKRLIAVSAAGVGDSQDKIDPELALMIRESNIAKSYRDLDNMEQVYINADIDCLIVRPVTLTNEQTNDPAKLVEYYELSSQVSRSGVAGWMIDGLERPTPFETSTEMLG